MSTFTGSLRLTKQGIGDNNNTWGTIANTQYDLLDTAITGVLSVNCTTGSNITLSTANGSADEARNMVLKLSGTPSADIDIVVPAVNKVYLIDASFSGANTVTIAPTGGGSGVSFEAGQTGVVYCDGTDVREIYSTVQTFQSGMIIMWSGSISTIPDGWFLCDGSNGTPDLRDKFVVGARQDDAGTAKTLIEGSLTVSGGAISATTTSAGSHDHGGETSAHALTVAEMPSHHHPAGNGDDSWNLSFGFAQGGFPGAYSQGSDEFTASVGGDEAHSHGISAGGVHTHDIQITPPYYALAFIMKQ